MKRIVDLARTLTYAIAVAILIFSSICMLMQIKPAVVISGSMEPAIKTGSLILINEKDKDISKGDIIAFKTGGASVAHRVVQIEQDGYVTKGDSNRTVDASLVAADKVEGTVFFKIPLAGYAVKWMSSTPGIIMLIGIAIVLLVLGYLLDKGAPDEKNV